MALKTLFSNLIHSSKPTSLRLKNQLLLKQNVTWGVRKKFPKSVKYYLNGPLKQLILNWGAAANKVAVT